MTKEDQISNVMTSARTQTFCKQRNIFLGCCDGYRVCLRNIIDRNITLSMYKHHF